MPLVGPVGADPGSVPEAGETIVAISTAIGVGAIGIVRLSGPDAIRLAEQCSDQHGRHRSVRRRSTPCSTDTSWIPKTARLSTRPARHHAKTPVVHPRTSWNCTVTGRGAQRGAETDDPCRSEARGAWRVTRSVSERAYRSGPSRERGCHRGCAERVHCERQCGNSAGVCPAGSRLRGSG